MESQFPSSYSLEKHGIKNTGFIDWNLATPLLYERAIREVRQAGPQPGVRKSDQEPDLPQEGRHLGEKHGKAVKASRQ
jgi:hypothetical protein